MSGNQWSVAQSPTDPDMYCVGGSYIVADCLPIEDARLIAAAPDLLEALQGLLAGVYGDGYVLPAGAVATCRARTTIAKATGNA